MRRPRSPVAKLRSPSQLPANQAYRTQAPANITAVSPKAHHVTSAVGGAEDVGRSKQQQPNQEIDE